MNKIIYDQHQLSKKDIDTKLRQLIEELYGCCYLENITIDKLYPVGYKISMPLNNIERPFTFAIEAEGDYFYKYLRNVLIDSSLHRIDFVTIGKHSDCPDNIILDNIKGNYSNTHRVLQDNVIYDIG